MLSIAIAKKLFYVKEKVFCLCDAYFAGVLCPTTCAKVPCQGYEVVSNLPQHKTASFLAVTSVS